MKNIGDAKEVVVFAFGESVRYAVGSRVLESSPDI
jgi:hypothetical protein